MNRKIFITGSGGFVGKNLYRRLQDNYLLVGVDKIDSDTVDKQLDLSDCSLLVEQLDQFNPDVIVHLAALSNVEKCESDHALADSHNILPVNTMVDWSKKNDKKLIFVSTDYVFDGGKGGFSEKDVENPIQYYGKTKLQGERMVATLNKYVILRPTVIYGWDDNRGMNFFMQLYRKHATGEKMEIPVDQISNPTYVMDLCRLIKKILNSNENGTFVATGDQAMSRYDFATKICDIMGWDTDFIRPVETKSLGQIAKRPLNDSTCNFLVKEKFDFAFGSIEDNLQEIKQSIL